MKNIIFNLLCLISIISFSQTNISQSKSCGKCHKQVSINSKTGDICPYCGVKWGYQNTNSTTINKKTYSPSLYYYSPSPTNIPNSSTTSSKPNKENTVQSKNVSQSETKDWILSKLDKCIEQNCSLNTLQQTLNTGERITISNISFYFEGCFLVINYRKTRKNISKYDQSSFYIDVKEKIPIYSSDIVFNNLYKDPYPSFNNYASDKIRFYSKIKNIEIQETHENGKIYNSLSIGSQEICIDFDLEENLYNRILKAFTHLKTFCPPPVSNEKF